MKDLKTKQEQGVLWSVVLTLFTDGFLLDNF